MIRSRTVDCARRRIHGCAYVVILIIAEGLLCAGRRRFELVTKITVAELLREEQGHAKILLRCHAVFITQIAVIFGIEWRKKIGSLESGNALCHRLIGCIRPSEDIGPKQSVKRGNIGWILPEARRHGSHVRHPHFHRIERGPSGLTGEILFAPVEKLATDISAIIVQVKRRTKSSIGRGRRIAVAQRAAVVAQ